MPGGTYDPPDADPDGTIEVGPVAPGVIVRFKPADSTMTPGQRAEYACALLDFADREYGTDFGHCTLAPQVSCASTADGRE